MYKEPVGVSRVDKIPLHEFCDCGVVCELNATMKCYCHIMLMTSLSAIATIFNQCFPFDNH